MTLMERLLAALGAVKGPLWVKLVLTVVVCGLLPVAWLLDHLQRAHLRRQVADACGPQTARCGRGHTVSLVGAFVCPGCKVTRIGHAWAPCPHCPEAPFVHALICPCGSVVVSPHSPVVTR